MNSNFAPSLFRSLCEFVGDCYGPLYFAALPEKNTTSECTAPRTRAFINLRDNMIVTPGLIGITSQE